MKKLLPLVVFLGLLVAAWQFIQYLALPAIFTQQVQDSSAVPNSFKSLLGGAPTPEETSSVEWQVETVATGLQVPWSLAFINETDFLFTERPGQISLFQNGEVSATSAYVFERVRSNAEQGLMGLAVHPDFATNGFVYLCVSEPEGENYTIRISRLKAADPNQPAALAFDRDILTGIAGARVHAGCALVFGPDGKLYVATGDATQKGLAKDQNSLVGKVLRLNEDGTRPNDNPFAGSLVYSRGHRNPQGLAWHTNGSLYSTEHGPSVFDGPGGGDEVNRILAGEYYGWPDVSHEKTQEGALSPLVLYTPAEAPASLMAYSGKLFPQFRDNLFFGALKGQGVWRLEIDPSNPDNITKQEKLFGQEYGRIRHVTEAPDGSIYFTTSNRDGRGTAGAEDDRILRLVPKE